MTLNLITEDTDKQRTWFSDHWRLGIVFGIALIIRLALYMLYAPVSFSDSRTYQRLAEQILQGWINYDGTRTPGYPAFLAAIRTDQAVWFVQMGIGIVITDHSVRETLAITDRAYIMSEGEIKTSGPSSELPDDPIARKFYLGDRFEM